VCVEFRESHHELRGFAGDADMKADSTIKSRLFLSGIMVDAPPGARAVVTFGDSITDGVDSTPDANHRWPDVLAERLVQAGTVGGGHH
jgi:lysophospholipase L1-like esterase